MEIIIHPILIATGFGLNTDILETNLINQLILGAGLFFLGRDFLTTALEKRGTEIQTNIEDSEKRLKTASARLAEAKKEADQIGLVIKEIQTRSKKAQSDLLSANYQQAKAKVEQMLSKLKFDLANNERQFPNEIKQAIYTQALEECVKISKANSGAFFLSYKDTQDNNISRTLKYIQKTREAE